MHTYRRGEQLLAVALTVLAGFVDSVGFLFLGGVFLSFMSGNTTRFATAAVEGDQNLAVLAGSCLALFVVGVILGALVNRLAVRWWDLTRAREAVMATVCILFTLSSLLVGVDADRAATLVLSVGIGTMNSVFERDGEVAVPLTYMTGTLVKMGQRLVDAFFGGAHIRWISHLLLWMGLAAGAICGALVFDALGIATVYVIAGYMLVLTVVHQMVREWRRRHGLEL
ncbi:YoaK family protein [Corynebacterium terpenotabidum]|uniref:DUF1275 family protein n=1 Tax=Corynebacterium terpenotabidum Y-11 TaxID=1200352 RepID=S4XCB0_9CORY|nr:YoaK family protein [Corynebacterium terpenotabidum]AGP30757.1 hypothetical protein A606_05550 [Corynebacterium terpenotabidum Y-11]